MVQVQGFKEIDVSLNYFRCITAASEADFIAISFDLNIGG